MGLHFIFVDPIFIRRMHVNILPGFLEPVLSHLNQKEGIKMSRICTISFDEMKVRREFAYQKKLRKLFYQVIML